MNRITISTRPARAALACALLGLASLLGIVRTTTAQDAPALADTWLTWADKRIEAIVDIPDDQRTYANTVGAVDDVLARLEIELTFPQVMSYLSPDREQRELGQAVAKARSEWMIKLGQNEDLYKALKAYADTNPRLEGEQKRLLKFMLRDYRRAGMALPPDERAKLKEVQEELASLSIDFPQNTMEDETTVLLTPDELDGLDDEFVNSLDRVAGLYIIPMNGPVTMKIWEQCRNAQTRKKVWVAWKRIGGMKNVNLLEKILKLRADEAQMLGYRHSADYQLEILMAKNADTVAAFYDQVRPLVRKKAKLDYQQLTELKREYTADENAELRPWDYWFYHAMLKERDYAVDPAVVREYFPLGSVQAGLFDICRQLFNIEITDATDEAKSRGLPFWDEDVTFYEVTDADSGELLGELYLDLHPRPNKASGAFQWGFIPRKVWPDGTITKPRAVVQCNFPKPTENQPSLLTHDDVTTLFHEFGHFLHTVLTKAETVRFSGSNTEVDFVEFPSQLLENWCWDADVLRTFARHYKTGEPIPDSLVDGLLAARHLSSGMLAERQFYYGLIDQAYNTDPDGEMDTTQITLDLLDEAEMYDAVPGTYVQAGFRHLTNYIASYYGYQWSLVYSCDAFNIFRREGLLNPEVGQRLRDTVLSKGGTQDGMDMLVAFLGRKPRMEPYLDHLGLETESLGMSEAGSVGK